MPDTVTIRDGSAAWVICLKGIPDWTLTNWRAVMRHMARGGELNAEAADELAAWFPEAAQAACTELKAARETFERLCKDPKTLPRKERALQVSVNAELRRAFRQAQNTYDRLAARHHEFKAVKAKMRKEY